jgi:hypothetical protein
MTADRPNVRLSLHLYILQCYKSHKPEIVDSNLPSYGPSIKSNSLHIAMLSVDINNRISDLTTLHFIQDVLQ